ncbi:CRISPR-associated helicase/endonuclease Cas3 [Kiritimatiella glycovorans]|uniref:CRISPR-associated endonuclease/helicase Cas3 n=1 Tax=Kiritimatiella glycovorans TaxID=1307763 RepID=A0A0G3EG57_9BACT|nr:CRISPR-associated helicase/endonuclease Cas3 [Kiritimatiella glycovorans]AKJ65313.1 CRISPR-associated endonuclease/helicase Cas3 [Kiritimatiella glycovorans]
MSRFSVSAGNADSAGKAARNYPLVLGRDWYAKSSTDGGAGMSLFDHCVISGYVAARCCSRLGFEFFRNTYLPFLVSLHDVGKGSPGFLKHCSNTALQGLCPALAEMDTEASGWTRNHAEIGEAAFRAWAKQRGKSENWLAWAESIGSHHGTRSYPQNEGCEVYGGPGWARERKKFIDTLFGRFGSRLPDEPPLPAQIKLLAGLTCVSDWIASNDTFFPERGEVGREDLNRRVEQALDECGWSDFRLRSDLEFSDVFPFSPNAMQRAFIDCVDERGAYVLEAPTGLGKTEAALYAAYKLMSTGKNRGLYFGLPTRLTSYRIHKRVQSFMGRILDGHGFVNLAHGHAWMNLESRAIAFRAGKSWFHPSKRALLAPFGVGTIDQALMSVLRVKHHFVRTFGLAGKVVILDEVHSYDSYTGTLFDCLVDELLNIGCSVIILSATLTAERRKAFRVAGSSTEAYPVASTAHRSFVLPGTEDRSLALRYRGSEKDQLVAEAVKAAEAKACVLWIANTVAHAQEIFRKINGERREDSFETGLLHSRFPAFRRAELEDKWMEALGKNGPRPRGCILVATQVVEQSVDIDADMLVTELAPTDMLLQRMGRICRHERKERPEGCGKVWIYGPNILEWEKAEDFCEDVGSSRFVYAPYILWKTLEVWLSKSSVSLPGDVRALLKQTYDDSALCPEWATELKGELDEKRRKLAEAALGATTLYCGEDDENRAPTRYSERPTLPALILRQCDDLGNAADLTLCNGERIKVHSGERDYGKAVLLHQSIVALPARHGFRPMPPPWLRSLVYGPLWVLILKNGEEDNVVVDLRGAEVPWGYRRDVGVYKRPCRGSALSYSTEMEDENESYY